MDMLSDWTEAVRLMQKGPKGASLRIETDKETIDHLAFCIQQREVRRVSPGRRWPYTYVEILGVPITERVEAGNVSFPFAPQETDHD